MPAGHVATVTRTRPTFAPPRPERCRPHREARMATTSDTLMFPDASTLTETQLERRQRILSAAQTLASRGGFDGVQMRAVAEKADVALGTLYRYFSSKVHLLVALTYERSVGFLGQLERTPPYEEDPVDRVHAVMVQLTRILQQDPSLTEAMLRAVMVADASAASAVHRVNELVTQILLTAYHGGRVEPTAEDESRARVLEMVWLTSLLAWLSGRASSGQVDEDLSTAARLIMR
jgi:TetR/AcrR family transcriptional regulator, cholesterol catabolism regulator